MCLYIVNGTIKTARSKSRKVAYKVCWIAPDGTLWNLYTGDTTPTKYILGKRMYSSRIHNQIDANEQITGQIYDGFHVLFSRRSAMDELQDYNKVVGAMRTRFQGRDDVVGGFAIVKCEVSPDDHIADGAFGNKDGKFDSAVYRALTPIEVLYKMPDNQLNKR